MHRPRHRATRSSVAGREVLRIMYIVYIDDSGTNNHARIVSGACCVASAKNWKKFERQWNAIGESAGFRYFHMTEFAGCRPDEWCRDCQNGKQTELNHPWRKWSNRKRKKVLGDLAETVNKYADYGMGVAIRKIDYHDFVLQAPLRNLAGDLLGERHYTFAIQCCGGGLANWRDSMRLTKPMKYVFDTTDDLHQRDEITNLFSLSATRSVNATNDGITPTGYAFESRKDTVQLLAADMLAWVSAKQRACEVFDGSLSAEGMIVARVFINGKKLSIGKIETGSLRNWAEKETAHRVSLERNEQQ
jgi:hypothetical protein